MTAWPEFQESFIERPDGTRLFVRESRPVAAPVATVLITHGLGEHSGRYGHLAGEFRDHGWRVVAWDLRGHGRSSGERGDVTAYAALVEDLRAVRAHFQQDSQPFFLFAHSLGGQIVLHSLLGEAAACAGAVVASPWLRLAFDPPWWKLFLAQLAMRVWPGFVQKTGNHWEKLSRDEAHLKSFPDPALVHHVISARMYFAVRQGGEKVIAEAARVRVPLLLLHGDDDPVTCHHTTSEFFEKAGSTDKTLRIFPGARHETHNDLDRAVVVRAIVEWIAARLVAGVE